MWPFARLLCVVVLLLQGATAGAQDTTDPAALVPQAPILTIEPERLFADSLYGKRITAEIEAEGSAIAADNRQIEAELTEEERALTELRATLPAAEFRAKAEAFDEKVTRLRREQDAKARALGQKNEETRRAFFVNVRPVLGQIMRDAGAAVLLERRNVFLAADVIDITTEAITRVDEALGDGTDR